VSELKELCWDVQETVQPSPFDALERRGIRRRHRWQALTGAVVVAAITIAVLAALLPLGNVTGTEKSPTAGNPASIAVDQAAEKLIRDKKSGAAGIAFATPTRWASVWSSPQSGYAWKYAAVVSRDGVRTTAPVRKNQYVVLRAGDEALALSMPTSMKGSDPSWAQSVMVRLTDKGRVREDVALGSADQRVRRQRRAAGVRHPTCAESGDRHSAGGEGPRDRQRLPALPRHHRTMVAGWRQEQRRRQHLLDR
jgi:hypothetical protein